MLKAKDGSRKEQERRRAENKRKQSEKKLNASRGGKNVLYKILHKRGQKFSERRKPIKKRRGKMPRLAEKLAAKRISVAASASISKSAAAEK